MKVKSGSFVPHCSLPTFDTPTDLEFVCRAMHSLLYVLLLGMRKVAAWCLLGVSLQHVYSHRKVVQRFATEKIENDDGTIHLACFDHGRLNQCADLDLNRRDVG